MADIVTNVLQIGSNNLILQDADAQEQLVAVKNDVANIIESAYVTDTASGAIASFPDGADNVPVKSLTVNVEPVQDLHGQANPYPAGGGKNLLNITDGTSTVGSVTFAKSGGVVSASGSTTTADANHGIIFSLPAGNYYFGGAPSGASSSTCDIYMWDNTVNARAKKWNGTTNSESDFGTGNKEFQIVDGHSYSINMRVIKNQSNKTYVFKPIITKSTDASATYASFAPYSNICPISGHTQAVVKRTGVNLYPGVVTDDRIFDNGGATHTSANGVITITPAITSAYNSGCYIYNQPGVNTHLLDSLSDITDKYQVTYSYDIRASRNVGIRYGNSANLENASITTSWQRLSYTYDKTTSFVLAYASDASTALSIEVRNFQVEFGSTATAYEPYSGQTVTIDLDGTRYGGTLDVGTGVLTVDREYQSITSQQISSTAQYTSSASDSTSYYFNLPNILTKDGKPSAEINANNTKCDKLLPTNGNTLWNNKTKEGVTVNNKYVSVRVFASRMSGTTASALASAFPDGIEIVYPLASPFTVQLTAEDITTLLGQNNIWNDCGDTEVEYRADTRLYIEKLTAPTEDDMIADHAISANSFFMVGNTLYRATTAIASGATITVGTNATKLSLSDALNALA